MSLQRKLAQSRLRRALRVRARLNKTVPRVSVFRSLKHVYVQLIDDQKGVTLASSSSLEEAVLKAKGKKEQAFEVGKKLAERARECGVDRAVFDRGRFLYHGRVQSVVEGLRDGGLKI